MSERRGFQEQYLSLLSAAARAVAVAAEAAFLQLLDLIRAGQSPQAALATVLAGFRGSVLEGFREALEAILERRISLESAAGWKVGNIRLSDALYSDSLAVAAAARAIIEKHLQGPQSARALAKALYDGYDFKADPLKVVKPLPKYLQREFDRFAAAKLKTPALRAAYLQAIEKAEAQAGAKALEKALKVAFYERNRYLANRIAQTELHRAYTDRQAREMMGQDRVQYVRVYLSRQHTARDTDICDYHTRADLHGLGPGTYPKASCPKPPFHPHCRCHLGIALLPKIKPQYRAGAEQSFLRSLSPDEARRVAGGQGRLERALKGESLESICNAGQDPFYLWKKLGDTD